MDLLERDDALGVLAAALDSAAEGRGRLVLVTAEAGGGKTALVRTFADRADVRTLWGGCDDLVTPLPFGPLLDLARNADPGLEQALLDGERDRAFTRLLDTLERRPTPVLMVIEDVQWIDQASADTLTAVAQRIDRLPVLLVVTSRSEVLATDHPAQRISWRAPADAVSRVDLAPLSLEAVTMLTDPRTAAEILHRTGGNPYFVTQLVESGGRLTPTLTDAIRSRAAALPPATFELLELVAINPTRAEGRLLDRVAPGWEADIEAAEAAGLVDVRPDAVAFRHELARHAFESSLLAARRRALHARVLEAARALELAPSRLVHHATGAGAVDVILHTGPVAAMRARAAGSHREAAAHLRRVLEHAEHLDRARLAETEEAFCVEAWTIHMPDEAEAAARRALTIRRAMGGPPEAIGRNLRRIARVRWFVGDSDAAIGHLDEAIEIMERGDPAAVRDELATTVAYRGMVAGIREGATEARPFTTKAMAMVEDCDDRRLLALVLSEVGTVDMIHANDPTLLRRSIQLADEVGLHVDVVRGQASLASGALIHRDYPAALGHLADADAYAGAHQVYAFGGLIGSIRAQVLFETGDWDGAEQAAAQVLGLESFARLPAAIVTARLKVRRGDPDAPEAVSSALEAAFTTGEAQRIVPAMGAAAEHAWMQDRLGDVIDDVERAHVLALRSGSARWIGETSIWLSGAGRLERIPTEAEHVAQLMARAQWDESAAEWDRIGSPYEAAACRVMADDVDTVLAGLAELDRIGAAPMARRTRTRLARMGVERIPRGPRRATAANPAGLTARQMDVLGLVVEGFTNAEIAERLFLSARTVDHHVAAILLKLEVESRRQVRQRAEELGIVT